MIPFSIGHDGCNFPPPAQSQIVPIVRAPQPARRQRAFCATSHNSTILVELRSHGDAGATNQILNGKNMCLLSCAHARIDDLEDPVPPTGPNVPRTGVTRRNTLRSYSWWSGVRSAVPYASPAHLRNRTGNMLRMLRAWSAEPGAFRTSHPAPRLDPSLPFLRPTTAHEALVATLMGGSRSGRRGRAGKFCL